MLQEIILFGFFFSYFFLPRPGELCFPVNFLFSSLGISPQHYINSIIIQKFCYDRLHFHLLNHPATLSISIQLKYDFISGTESVLSTKQKKGNKQISFTKNTHLRDSLNHPLDSYFRDKYSFALNSLQLLHLIFHFGI